MKGSIKTDIKKPCLCECHYPKPMCCQMNCCCSCIYFLHESSPNLSYNFCNINESQPLLFHKKEKELFLQSENRTIRTFTNKKESETPNKNIKNKKPLQFNRILDKNYFSKLFNINMNSEIEDISNISNYKDEKKIKKNKTEDKNLENPKLLKYKKIKVNKMKKDRETTIPNSNLDSEKKNKKIIDMNNFIPINKNRKQRGKYINDYELKKYNTTTGNETSINNKNIDNIKYNHNNKKLNITNLNGNKLYFNYGPLVSKKLKMNDLNDDIIDKKQNYSSVDNNNKNKLVMKNLRNEIEIEKHIINNLRKENEELKYKIKLYEKEQETKNINKINKSTNTPNYNENEKDKNQNENIQQILIERSIFEKQIINLKKEISEITLKIKEYENYIAILTKRNNDQENIIKKKDKEIFELKFKLDNLEKENKIKINELYSNKIEMIKERENISNDYKMNNDNLKQEIIKLNEIIINKEKKIKELEIKFKYEKKYDNKKQLILELLFNFYIKVKKIINYEKSKSKELLKDIIDIMSVEDFELELNKVEKKIKQIIDDIQIKYGHCFACDIACCTSHVDKLKTFRKNITSKNNL